MIFKKRFRKDVGVRLRETRHKLGLSQDALGKTLGLTHSTIARYELGTRIMTPEILALLNERFNLSLDWLLCDKGTMFLERENTMEAAADASEMEEKEMVENMIRFPLLMQLMLAHYRKFKKKYMDVRNETDGEEETTETKVEVNHSPVLLIPAKD